ncbi:MAG: nucleotidyltransferase domain-containing protein [Agriterribacter sp.]
MTVSEFAIKHDKRWNELEKAEKLTEKNIQTIANTLMPLKLASTDVDIVVFGSIARNECTVKSDVDWTILVDGQVDSDHRIVAQAVEKGLDDANLAKPGISGLFGQITFSHDLVHYIGGEDDTNHNLSRRLLLLLESKKIEIKNGKTNAITAYNRVMRGIISEYITHDSGFSASSGKENVPRFLLNDIIRFWRTMCVDFAFKQRTQGGKKWALRNIKLRMSRRLIFIKGLLLCYQSYLKESDTVSIIEELDQSVRLTPLDLLITILVKESIDPKIIFEILDSYNEFLAILNDEETRQYLTDLKMEEAYGDGIFETARENSHRFQKALNKIFIFDENKIQEFTLKYGIF